MRVASTSHDVTFGNRSGARRGNDEPPVRARPRWQGLFLEAVVLAGFVAFYYVVPEGATPWVLAVNLATFYLMFARALVSRDRVVPGLPTYLSVEVLFLAYGYLIFYFPYQLFLVGATDLRVTRFVSNSFVDGSNEAVTLATVGMLAFTVGYRALGSVRPVPAAREERAAHAQSSCAAAMASMASASLLVLVTIYLVAGWRTAGEGRYTGTTTDATGVEGFATVILVLCMIVTALWIYAVANAMPPSTLLLAGVVVAVGWAVRLLLLGDRNSFLLVALVVLGGYVTFVRRASIVLIGGAFGLWLFVYYAVEALRAVPDWYRSGSFWQTLEHSSVGSGSSGDTSFNVTTMALRATVEVVPSTHDFMHGAFKLTQLTSVVPFSSRLYKPYVDTEYANSADMLSEVLLGSRPRWGTGTNVISDAYLDFGVLGVATLLFGIGVFAKVVRNAVVRKPWDPQRFVVYLMSLALLAELPRYAIEVPLRMLTWAVIFMILVGLLARRRAPRDRVHTRPGVTSHRPSTRPSSRRYDETAAFGPQKTHRTSAGRSRPLASERKEAQQ